MRVPVLFVGGIEDGLRLDADLDDPKSEVARINSIKQNDDGYALRKIRIENANGLKEEFYIYTPELWTNGDLHRQLIAGYRVAKG
jgi:hypothetical protein